MKAPLYPAPLKKGATLGIIAPAGQLHDKAGFFRGIGVLQEMGFHVRFPQDLWPGTAYLADSDDNRGYEFNRLIADPEIKGLVSMRGGYGCLRMLDKIDLTLVVRNPKMLVGFSDITILQNYLYEQTGLVSLHGPVVTSLYDTTKEALESLSHCLTRKKAWCVDSAQIKVLQEGPEVVAPLMGGNLTSMVTLLGTRYDFPWENKIVFLEDINEPSYKIDRMLTQLKLAGKLEAIAGLILGDFSSSANRGDSEKNHYRQAIWDRALEICSGQDIPVWGNFPSGHCPGNFTFPLGAAAVMESRKTRLLFQ